MKNLQSQQSQLRIFFFFLLSALTPLALFADNLLPSGLQNLGESVMEIFTGPLVKTILICCLAGCAAAYGFNKDNEKMKRNVIAIAIAIAIVVGAQFIVEKIWAASK